MSVIENGMLGPEPTHTLLRSSAVSAPPLSGQEPAVKLATTEAYRPMKVLLVSLFHPELVRGGAQQVCYELFQGLKSRRGIEPTLLAAVDPSFKSLYKSGAQITGFDGRAGRVPLPEP